jgi:hypothetical protein
LKSSLRSELQPNGGEGEVNNEEFIFMHICVGKIVYEKVFLRNLQVDGCEERKKEAQQLSAENFSSPNLNGWKSLSHRQLLLVTL